MENSIIRVQLASKAGAMINIESTHKNTIKGQDITFDEALLKATSDKFGDNSTGQSRLTSTNLPFINGWHPNVGVASEGISNAVQGYRPIVAQASEQYGVPQMLINAVIRVESGFNANATSYAGAKGLMQLMDGTAKGLGVVNSYDPQQNIFGGTKYLSTLLSKYDGELKVALAAYNAGPARVDRTAIKTNDDFDALKSLLPKETQRYVEKVMSYLKET